MRSTQISTYPSSDWVRKPVREIIDEIKRLALSASFSDTDLLWENLLIACYQAEHWTAGNLVGSARDRERIDIGFGQLQQQEAYATSIQEFISLHRDLATNAFAYSPNTPTNIDTGPSNSAQEIDLLFELVNKYRQGLIKIKNFEHISNRDALLDFGHGPLLLAEPIRIDPANPAKKRQLPDAQLNGLIFHLTYLFRYFTGLESGLPCRARMAGRRLVVEGPMITIGEPHYAFVAMLVNATLSKKYNSKHIKDHLRDLHRRPARKSDDPIKNPKPNRRAIVEFLDWDIVP